MLRPWLILAWMALPLVAACSSAFGGGSDAPPTKVIVVPQGSTVCPSGNPPPCS